MKNKLEYAILVKKVPFNSDIFLYDPIEIIKGYRTKDNIFHTEVGTEWMNVEDASFNYSEEEFGYILPVTNEFLKEVSKENKIRDGLEKFDYFYDIMNNYLIIGKYLKEKFEISTIRIDDILKDKEEKGTKEEIKKIEDKHHEEKQKELEEAFNKEESVSRYDVENIVALENVKKLYNELNRRIIGQKDAIDSIVSTIYMNESVTNPRERTRCFLVGPTGSGKSEIINTIKDVYNIPVVHIDSTTKTAPGYVGDNLTDDLADLITMAGGNIEKAEHGIVAFDELDKKGTLHNGDVNGKDVINELLRFCDGTTYNISYVENGRKKTVRFDTSNLIILASGAFPEVFDAKKKEKGKNGIGFESEIKEEDDEFIKLTPNDLATIGKMGSELMGRFTMIATLKRLSKEDLKKILLDSSISPLKLMERNFGDKGIRVYYDDEFLDKVAEDAYNLNTGGRGLKSIIDNATKDIIIKLIVSEEELEDENGNINIYGKVIDNKPVFVSKINEKEEEKPKILVKEV